MGCLALVVFMQPTTAHGTTAHEGGVQAMWRWAGEVAQWLRATAVHYGDVRSLGRGLIGGARRGKSTVTVSPEGGVRCRWPIELIDLGDP